MSEDKKIITAPDQDLTDGFKILLIDFEWPEIQEFTQSIKKLPGPVSLFLYGMKDTDPVWCLTVAQNCNSVLMDMRQRGENDVVKGILIPKNYCWYLGHHKLDSVYHNKVIDMYSWLAVQYKQYHKPEE